MNEFYTVFYNRRCGISVLKLPLYEKLNHFSENWGTYTNYSGLATESARILISVIDWIGFSILAHKFLS